MVVACLSVAAVCHPASVVSERIASPLRRRIVIGVLMGVTAVVLIYSPLGQRSGAHMNPGTTLTFYVLGKVSGWDAAFYVCAQFMGGIVGVRVARLLLGAIAAHPSVNHAATLPGPHGLGAAWLGEWVIGLVMMTMVLTVSNHHTFSAYTGLFAGALVTLFIVLEAPFSGMSLNPARTLGSAISARAYRGLWIYFTAPPLGMLFAAGLYSWIAGSGCVYCAKLNHAGTGRCIFECRILQMPERGTNLPLPPGIASDSESAITPSGTR